MRNTPIRLADALGHEVADKRLDILRRIGEVGSISEAARAAGVSYKAAWQAIDTLSNLAGVPLLVRCVGGSGGGGAELTAAGQQLLATAELLSQARAQVLAGVTRGPAGVSGPLPHVGALGLRTSMRNQLPCTVSALKRQGQAIRVELALPDGSRVFSRVTRASAELLGLVPQLAVLALCKATAVNVVAGAGVLDVQGRNLVSGRATRVSRAAAGGEVALALDCGLQLVGFSGPANGLRVGSACVAHVDESALVIALG